MFGFLRRSTLEWRLLFAVLVAAVAYLALTPTPPPTFDTGWDKLNHTLAFMALTVAGCNAFPGSNVRMAVVALALVGFGGLIEVLQYFVPGRSSEWFDLCADCVGIVLGTVLMGFVGPRAMVS